ncbi:M16 family metallopeptidase [Fulvivirga lutea]|uniref:Insulinase family protein n=1 Tax=Fulvivirga lutea TaxID=2810512 RepID=A0A974WHK9_9BACT|nr:pitrilysin family protein [Fulvivirga lutea]QSE98265.1 insulinase family protein [Fulvivirga lutea]
MKNLIYILFILITAPAWSQEVVELPMTSTKVVVKFAFKNGSITDPEGKEGLTNLTASVLTQSGSDKYTKSQIDDLIYPMAAQYGSFTDKEMTTFTFEVHKDFLDKFYDIFSSLLLNPTFDQKDFDRVKSNTEVYVKEVIKANSDEDFSKMALEEKLFAGTGYEHMKAGTVNGLANITREDVVSHYKKYFTRNNVTVGIAGSYPASFVQKVKADINKLSDAQPEIPALEEVKMPDGIRVQLVPKPNNLGTAVYTGYPIEINRASKDWPALLVVNSYLGEHRKSYSKLYQLIREQRSMNYGDYTYIEWYEAGGSYQLPLTGFPRSQNYFAIWLRPVQTAISLKGQYPELADIKIGHAHFALRMAVNEINRVKTEGLTQEEFDLTRQFLRSYMKLFIQTPERQLGFLLDSKFYGMDNYIELMDKKLASLTLEEVNAAAAKYLQTENMYVTMITDTQEAEPLKKSLLNNQVSPMAYSNIIKESLPEEVFELDKKVEGLKLNVTDVQITDPKELFVD